MTQNYYTPGVCNINPKEIAYRKKAFYLGLIIGAPLLLVLLALDAPAVAGVLMFLPAWIGAIGYLQAKNKFCIGYAAAHVKNSSAEFADTTAVTDKSEISLDTAKAQTIKLQAILVAVLVTALTVGALQIV